MIKVLLAEDMHMFRGALVTLLNLEDDINVVADVASGDEIMPAAHRFQPDVAVIDLKLPGKDGLAAAQEVQRALPGCRTMILTIMSQPSTLRRALAARVDGFLLKDTPANKLVDAVRDVALGRRVVDNDLMLAAWETEECPLTGRETEVLRLAADGAGAVDIANSLRVSTGTIRNYLTAAVKKLEARNRVDAIRIAKESGWL